MKYSRILLIALLTLPLLFSCKDQEDPLPVEICGNGIDDDGDGFVDYEDFDCTETGDECGNGIDDDGDGFIDMDDLDCTETGDECNNGIDDDGDGFIDNEDFDCQ